MINLEIKSTQEKYYNSIIIYSHRQIGQKRADTINRISQFNPLLAAKCIMQCESNEEVENNIAEIAEAYANNYEDIPRATIGYLSLIELRNFERFRNVLLGLEYSSLRYLTFVFKELFNAVDAKQILSIVQSIVEIQQVKNGIKTKLLLDIMKFIIMSNTYFEKTQITQLISLYEGINSTLRLSQLATFLQCSKQDITEFLSQKGIHLKSGENPNVKYMYLGYFVGQAKIVNKDKITFAESFIPKDTSIGVPKLLLEAILSDMKTELQVGYIYQKKKIIDIIQKRIKLNTDKKFSAFITEMKRLNIISFDHLALDTQGIQRSFYKIMPFPDVSELKYKDIELESKDIKPIQSANPKKSIAQKPKAFVKGNARTSPSEFGEKLAAAINKRSENKN